MRAKLLLILLFVAVVGFSAEPADTVRLPEVEVSVSRAVRPAARQQMQVSVLDMRMVEQAQVASPKDVASLAPNVYMPDYGSAMTSSIYIRGMGSRINEPVMGMVVDGVPITDKNMYDHILQDIVRIELLRGPQGSIYGRNSPAGVMEIRTLQPMDLSSFTIRAMASYASGNSVRAQLSFYQPVSKKFGWGVAARYNRTDGFHPNLFCGKKADFGQQAGGRLVFDSRPADGWRVTGAVYGDWVEQGAFPYASVATGEIRYNREGGYRRLSFLPSVRAEYKRNDYRLLLTGAYHFLQDDMRMDQDYTAADIFTLQQKQKQHNATFDALLYAPSPREWYEWMVGVSAFTKVNEMHAPVTFMREGIEELILGNANRGLQTVFPKDTILISDDKLLFQSDFDLLNAGVSAYHRSHFHFGNWHIIAGVRFDYEHVRMDYLSASTTHYRFTKFSSQYTPIHTLIDGVQRSNYFQVLPRLSVSYDAPWVTVYAYAANGYKAGGYNPQIFSTITQNRVMNDLANDMGVHLEFADERFTDISVTSYKPESDWTFEVGAHFTPADGLRIDADVFHTRCYNQQVTVFPNGKTTGRMMANAARSRMWGAETALHYRWYSGKWRGLLDASYGFTDARFISFNDGMGDYSGNFIPYSPQHTLHGLISAEYVAGKKWLQSIGLSLKGDGIGKIYWNEQNDCAQPFYGLLGAMLSVEWQYVKLQLWGRNLTGTNYDVFYFRSMGNNFLQQARPREMGVDVIINI